MDLQSKWKVWWKEVKPKKREKKRESLILGPAAYGPPPPASFAHWFLVPVILGHA